MNNDIISWDPVDRGGNAVLVAGLEGVDDAEDLGSIAAGGGWVGEDCAAVNVSIRLQKLVGRRRRRTSSLLGR